MALTPAQFNAWRVANGRPALSGAQLRDAYWEYRGRVGEPVPGSPQAAAANDVPTPVPEAPAPVVEPRPGPTPGTLDERGQEDITALNEWRANEEAGIQAALDRAGVDRDEGLRRNETARTENLRRTVGHFGARGLLRSGLRAAGEAKVEAGHVDATTAIGRRFTDLGAEAARARTRLANTFGTRERDAYRSSFDRALAEFNASGGSVVSTPPAPSAPAPSPPGPPNAVRAPSAPRAAPPRRPPARRPTRNPTRVAR